MSNREFLNRKISHWQYELAQLDVSDPHFSRKAKLCEDAIQTYRDELERKTETQTTLKVRT